MKPYAWMVLLAASPALACEGLEADGAWVREAPPGARVMVGYAGLRNAGTQPLAVNAVSSEAFEAAELHRTVIEDGIARMLHGQTIEIPAGGNAVLAPGGLHIMLFRPLRAPKAGDRISITFHCAAEQKTFPFTVSTEAP